jgi:hypothetical protein
MIEYVTHVQKKKLSKIFRKTKKTFQAVAFEAGLKNIPIHLEDLTRNDARVILKKFHYCLVEGKEKQ